MGYWVSRVVGDLLLTLSFVYIIHKLDNKNIDFKDYKLYITIFFITILSLINCEINYKAISMIFITVVFIFSYKYLFRLEITKSIVVPIFYQFILMISETIFALFLVIFLNNNSNEILDTYLGSFITNLIISFLSIIISLLPVIKKIYNNLLKLTEKIKKSQFSCYMFFLIIALSVFPITIYYNIKFVYLLIFYSLMLIGIVIMVIISLSAQSKLDKVSNKYNVAVKSLNNYEEILQKQKIDNHENKNMLLTIRTMIVNKDNSIIEYIDSVIKDKYSEDQKLLYKINVIPSGGLKATIYSEILKIKNNNINYSLNLDQNLKTLDFINLETNEIVDICKIIGVFIDNSIDEVRNLELKKDKIISISIYFDNSYLNIEISNIMAKNIELNKIFNPGYTTKGSGHGYGLSLVKKLINNNSNLENRTEISNNVFKQILNIKLNN